MTFTVETLLAAMAKMKELDAEPCGLGIGGTRIYCDPNALAETTERNFPASRHRSRRVHKKLCKRFGGEFKKVPTIFKIGNALYAHPTRYVELQRQIARY